MTGAAATGACRGGGVRAHRWSSIGRDDADATTSRCGELRAAAPEPTGPEGLFRDVAPGRPQERPAASIRLRCPGASYGSSTEGLRAAVVSSRLRSALFAVAKQGEGLLDAALPGLGALRGVDVVDVVALQAV